MQYVKIVGKYRIFCFVKWSLPSLSLLSFERVIHGWCHHSTLLLKPNLDFLNKYMIKFFRLFTQIYHLPCCTKKIANSMTLCLSEIGGTILAFYRSFWVPPTFEKEFRTSPLWALWRSETSISHTGSSKSFSTNEMSGIWKENRFAENLANPTLHTVSIEDTPVWSILAH